MQHKSSIEDLLGINISDEKLDKIVAYEHLLIKWNKKINLVSDSTIKSIWQRHILDSAQIVNYIDLNKQTITDIGTGAGLPGIVLAILTGLKVNLVEVDKRKCSFLYQNVAQLKLDNVTIHNSTIEKAAIEDSSILTARALAPLERLFKIGYHLIKKNKFCIFLKGQNIVEEIEEASKYWDFSYEIFDSATSKDAKVFKLNALEMR